MKPIQIPRAILYLGIALIQFNGCSRTAEGPMPNVVLIITDDQGYGEVGFHSNKWIHTPNIDELARESSRLTDFHVGTTCAPTRSGLMTGRNCNRVGVWHTVMGRSLLRKTEVTMADVFKSNGYATGMFGKWHLGDNYPYRPNDRGFEEAFYHGGGGLTQAPDYWDNDYFDDTYLRNGKPEKAKGYCTDVWFQNALAFIEKNRQRPFFCYLATNAPHSPFHVEQRYINMYSGNPDIVNPNFYGMITNIDENLGLLRQKLEEFGIADNTILIFMTDNGTAAGVELDNDQFIRAGYNAGMRGKKGSEYNGGHRVPFFLYWKEGDLHTGKDVNRITAYTDVFPTLIDLCGLEAEEIEFDGQSLRSLLYGNGKDWADRIIITDTQREDEPVKWKKCAIMTDRWHLIRGKELYDMESDPGQVKDVSGKHPELVEKLRRAYEVWWSDVSIEFDDYCEIILDMDKENPLTLRSHDWHCEGLPPWNQGHIRRGQEGNGFWVLDVAEKGTYRFAIRRWPVETGLAMNASLPEGEQVSGGEPQPEGVSIEYVKATMKAGDTEETIAVDPGAEEIRFSFELEPGEFHLQSWLEDKEGITRGAYYIYVTRLD